MFAYPISTFPLPFGINGERAPATFIGMESLVFKLGVEPATAILVLAIFVLALAETAERPLRGKLPRAGDNRDQNFVRFRPSLYFLPVISGAEFKVVACVGRS